MTPEIHVHGAPGRCPYCKDAITDLRHVVACAACGARHHDQCREQHGRCAVCSSTELLVYKKTEPTKATGLDVSRDEERVAHRWRLLAKDGLALAPLTGYLTLEPTTIEFLAAANRRFYEVRGDKASVGAVTQAAQRLTIVVSGAPHVVATESIGYSLTPGEVGALAEAVRAWKLRV